MKISKIEHLGIAVPNIEEALPYYENVLGFTCYNIETVEEQKVRTAFLKVGETKIELLEPTSPDSTIAKFLETRGQGIHHIAYAVEDGVKEALAECEAKEVRTPLSSFFLYPPFKCFSQRRISLSLFLKADGIYGCLCIGYLLRISSSSSNAFSSLTAGQPITVPCFR